MQDDAFIINLSRGLKPKVSIVPSQRPLLGWLLFSLVVLGWAVAVHALREDVNVMLERGSYYFELFSGLSVGIIAAGSALTMRIPGAKAPLKVLGTAIAVWLASLILHSLTTVPLSFTFNLRAELGCMGTIFSFGALPAVALWWLVKRGATTEPKLSLALVAIAFTGVAAAFLPLACGNDGFVHLLVGHASPLLVAALVSRLLGPKLLSW